MSGTGTNDLPRAERPVLERPLIVISAPRAGSTLLLETLARSREVWTVGGESHRIIESFPELQTERHGYDSHRLDAARATPRLTRALREAFADELVDSDGRRWRDRPAEARPATARFLEKTPRNALRVAFLDAVFPDARYVLLHRDPRENVASIIEAWRAPGFWQFRGDLPGWDREEWCMLLPPGWRSLVGRPLEEIAAFQWRASYEHALADLERVAGDRWITLDFADFLSDPPEVVRRLLEFADLSPDPSLAKTASRPLAPSSSVVTPPRPDKWRRFAAEIDRVMPSLQSMADRLAARPTRPDRPDRPEAM